MKFVRIPALLLAGALFVASCEQAPKSDEAKTGKAEKVDEKKAEIKAKIADIQTQCFSKKSRQTCSRPPFHRQ